MRFSFIFKLVGAVALVALADLMFYGEEPGATLGAFALAWTIVVALALRPQRSGRGAAVALLLAGSFALVLIDDPNPLAWLSFMTAIGSAALLTRARFDDAVRWGVRLVAFGFAGIIAPVRDLLKLARVKPHARGSVRSIIATLALPVIGGAVFIALFAGANPLIANAFAAIDVPSFWNMLGHAIFSSIAAILIWPSLRPRALSLGLSDIGAAPVIDVPRATLSLSLVTFNAIFAVENILDLVFLWSGAALPDGVTLADYAHRGAYALIVTALLAGLFVVVALRPGGSAAQSPLIRWLVIVWVAQNLLLVASSARRTMDYVAAYQLTELRIAALAWMALVAVGLVLICWRMLTGKSAPWLINANAAAAGVVLAASSVIDYGATAAAWNVRHAREGERIDLCYLGWLGDSALLPLIELERRAGGPRLADRAAFLRNEAITDLTERQADWHSWTWRGARRLAAAQAALGPTPAQPLAAPHGRDCDGSRRAPPPPAAPAPLTDEAER